MMSQSVVEESDQNVAELTHATAGAGSFVLPSELVTGNSRLDFDHQQLLACMARLEAICQQRQVTTASCGICPSTVKKTCQGNLVALLGDILAFILDHFQHEEQVMRDSLLMMVDRDVCEAHMEDHAAISAKVQEVVSALDIAQTPVLIGDLENLLESWVNNHIILHDLWLARWLQREDSMLALGNAKTR